MPPPYVEKAGRVLRSFLGRLPFIKATKGKISDDPRVEEEFLGCYIAFPHSTQTQTRYT